MTATPTPTPIEIASSLETIRETLLKLNATGVKGFEGLVGEIIYGITGIPSRLAKSGTQFGIDGDAIFPDDGICFEAKRYDGTLSKNEVITKVAILALNKDEADLLWVLGATTPVASQDATALREIAEKDGISVLILDWQDSSLPLLAVSLAMAKDRVASFIKSALKDDDADISGAFAAALSALIKSDDYRDIAKKLQSQFNAVELATTNAKHANEEWLFKVFSEKNTARNILGQPLAPLCKSISTLPRHQIIEEIYQGFDDQQKTIFLLGDEGSGKSWVAALTMAKFDGLALFISAERVEKLLTENELNELIIESLGLQCGQAYLGEVEKKRWRRRLETWENCKKARRLLVVLDGLNQRPKSPWDKIIRKLQNKLCRLGGHLIVTTRRKLFDKKIKKGLLDDDFLQINIKSWSETERDEILGYARIEAESLDKTTANSLLNPRLLGIALELFPADNTEAWQGLTVDRLLFEHLRLSRLDGVEPYEPGELAEKLSTHAAEALNRLPNSNSETARIFRLDTSEVAEGRFFEMLHGPGQRYQLKNEGLTLALGYALVDRVWTAHYDSSSLEEAFAQLLEPISALDRTADVVLAALTVCALDEDRFDSRIFITLLTGFANLQNLDAKQYAAFRDICFEQFGAFLSGLENCFLDHCNTLNDDWLRAVVWDAKENQKKWEMLAGSIDCWLGYFSKDPEYSLRGCSREDSDKWSEQVQNKVCKIEDALNSLSSFESELLAEMQEKNGNLSNLARLGIELLAGKPLAPFTRTFLKWGVAIGINADSRDPVDEFHHLTMFNQVDWPEMCDAFHQGIQPLKTSTTSRGGQWTVVRMLYATGVGDDARQAIAIATELRKDMDKFKGWRLIEEYCASDPCDPNSEYPDNIEATAKKYQQLGIDRIYQRSMFDENDLFRTDALPGVARFHPEVAVAKYRELLASIPGRTELPLRQVAVNGKYMMPLVTKEIADAIWAELMGGTNLNTLSENDRFFVGLSMLELIFSHLDAGQQLDAMSLPVFEKSYYLLSMIPYFKPFDAEEYTIRLTDACSVEPQQGIIPALAYLQYTRTELNSSTTELVLGLISHHDSCVRYCTFDVILNKRISRGVRLLYESDWRFDGDGVSEDEAWYGSFVLIEGTKQGIISVDAVFERCVLEAWIASLSSLDSVAQRLVIKAVDASIKLMLAASEQVQWPDFEISVKEFDFRPRPHYSLEGFQNNDQDKLFNYESFEEYQTRQQRLRDAFDKFKNSLDRRVAVMVLDRLTLSVMDTIASIAPEVVEKWSDLLLHANQPHFAQNLCYLIAKARSGVAPEEAVKLFRKTMALDSFMSVSYGNGLNVEHVAIWKSETSESIEALYKERLDRAVNDHAIAMEVLAAETCGKHQFILDYVQEGLLNEHPYIQARAYVVAGFSDQTENFSASLEQASQKNGLIGDAAKFALEAHKRCFWTKHWAKEMINAKTVEDFWCKSRLLAKIADGRLRLYLENQDDLGSYWPIFRKIIADETKKRADEWKKKREKTFLSLKSVHEFFM